jgi:hypothetical protein
MKKTLIIIIAIFIVIMAILLSKYYELRDEQNIVKKFNLEYEQYLDKEIYGTDIATIINKAVNDNENSFVTKDENGRYIQNDTSSVNIEIKIHDLEEDTIYTMETLYNGGMAQFVQYYNTILFKCEDIEYNSAGRVSYMLIEQITT